MVLTTSITMPSLVGVGIRALLGDKKFYVFCLSVTLKNDKICECHFAINVLEYGNKLGIIGKGYFCSCAPVFNFVSITE